MPFLPTTVKEMHKLGWDRPDVIIFSGDAYVDHPAFGMAVIGRTLEAEGLRVAIVPQPDWHGDHRDFRKFGRPRLFFAVSPGAMDSMVNKYTANKRLRSEDAYSPDGRHDLRPEYPTIVYTQILKQYFPDVPVVLGGIEASLRRLTHYDYWQDKLLPTILHPSQADLLIYGMGELPIVSLAQLLAAQDCDIDVSLFHNLMARHPQRQTVSLLPLNDIPHGIRPDDIVLHSHEECLRNKRFQAENFRHIEEQSNLYEAQRIIQETFGLYAVVNPPYPPLTQAQLDHTYSLPYTRQPHPKYQGKRIPAYDAVKFSICLHRGCFGGCAFCTISAHQGKFISSRSQASILAEAEAITRMPDFKGYISDLGGPSANMYGLHGKDLALCRQCRRPSCLHPKMCRNLCTDHSALLRIYRSIDALPAVKKSFVGSGIRYDLLLHDSGDSHTNAINDQYTEELITRHVSGRLKVAPEHTAPHVLHLMRKPSFDLFHQFKRVFDNICQRHHLRQQIVPYFISSHPGCSAEDMAELAAYTKELNFQLEQVQDFTPTPMTVSTETWYTGLHPYTLQPVKSAKTAREKLAQRQFFFWYKPSERPSLLRTLRAMGRTDLIHKLFGHKE